MQPGGIVCLIIVTSVVTAGCVLPGMHVVGDTPDPVIGQWIGGEPPESDMHMIFYENQTFLSLRFFITRGNETDTGTWTKMGPGQYSTRSVSGGITNWSYDPIEDSVFETSIPMRKYYRYKG